jgi:iron complex outermembrane receptor protein
MTHSRVFVRTIVFVLGAVVSVPDPIRAQARPDSSVTRRDTLESVVIRALRAPSGGTAAARHTVLRGDLLRTTTGQDAPLALRNTPSMTASSESGAWSGYSYVRMRGLDQSRLNITIDGVPLNDSEDQVLYFSNVPDLLNSISSVEVGRGVGASTFGTSSFAGSLNFQSIPLATTPRGGEVSLSAGSFNTWRASVQGATGVTSKGLAAYGRFSRQGTDGYRDHSGNDAWSAFGSAGWFRDRDALKVTAFAGLSGMRLAYYFAPESDLKVNRRANPLTELEGDRFHQEMVSAQYSRSLTDNLDAQLLLYRNSAAGAYDVNLGTEPAGGLTMGNFGLAHVWHGATMAFNWTSPAWLISLGGTASDYHRDHFLAIRPDLDAREYTNTGVKREAATFLKATWINGDVRVGGDLSVRYAHFRYRPSENAGIHSQPVTWSFVNPKFGITWDVKPTLSLFATTGRSWREPARGDLLAGADDLNSNNANDIIPFSQIHPEKVDDYELGLTWSGATSRLTTNLFAMEFHNEIAPIGKLALTGSPLRRNVDKSFRRGIELEGSHSFAYAGTLTGNFAWMTARIAEYKDEAADATYHDIEPLLTPPVLANLRWDSRTYAGFAGVGLSLRHVARMHLANDGNDDLVVPSHTMLDMSLRSDRGAWSALLEINNLLDADAYSSGYTDGNDRYLLPIATRNVILTLRRRL